MAHRRCSSVHDRLRLRSTPPAPTTFRSPPLLPTIAICRSSKGFGAGLSRFWAGCFLRAAAKPRDVPRPRSLGWGDLARVVSWATRSARPCGSRRISALRHAPKRDGVVRADAVVRYRLRDRLEEVNAMRWESGRRSDNVEDRRGMRVTPRMAGGGLGAIVIIVLALHLRRRPAPAAAGHGHPEPRRAACVAGPAGLAATPWQSSSRWCWRTRRTPGVRCSARPGRSIRSPSWCCSPARWSRLAASPRRRSVPSTVRTITSSTSTSPSTATCAIASRRRATSRRPM